MGMVISWKNNFRKWIKPFGNVGHEAAVKGVGPEHILALLAGILLFFCIELLLEQWLFDNDIIVDILGASTGALAILLLRFALVNARLYHALRTSSETLEHRISEIAHEFQTPLAILKGNLEILEESPNSQSGDTAALETAAATVDRLSRLVHTLLDVTKFTAPYQMTSSEVIDAPALVQEIYEDCLLLAKDHGIALSLKNVKFPALITANRDTLKEVLLNLLANALKYTPRGGSISIEVTSRGGFIEIAVSDTGCGIALENLPHIFERFYRIPDTDNPTAGTGLGLYISKQIVEAHGGTISVESSLGHGSRFTVRFKKS